MYKDTFGNIPTCNPYSTPTGCVNTFSCQFSQIRQQYQCCGDSPVTTVGNVAQALGCPGLQVIGVMRTRVNGVLQQAFVDPSTNQPRVCSSLTSQVCPVGFYCQYATTGVIQCCGLQGTCPNGRLAYVGSSGSPQQCVSGAVGSCGPNYDCVLGTDGSSVCCTRDGTAGVPIGAGLCPAGQIRTPSGQCLSRVQPNQPCQMTEQCLGGSFCQSGLCQCPPGMQLIGGAVCQPLGGGTTFPTTGSAASIGQQCTLGLTQCLGNSQCMGGICQCVPGQANVNGVCQQQQQTFNLDGYCPGNMRPVADNGVPRTCTGNTYACGPTSCVYSSARRQYYCCSPFKGASARQHEPETTTAPTTTTTTQAPGEQGCPVGRPLLYEFGVTKPVPIVCDLAKLDLSQCPSPYTCLPHSDPSRQDGQCCTTAAANNTRPGVRRSEVIQFAQAAPIESTGSVSPISRSLLQCNVRRIS